MIHIVRRAVRVLALIVVAVTGLALLNGSAQAEVQRAASLPAPVLTSPPDGTLFTDLASDTTLTWQRVPHARRYDVEVQCLCGTDWTAFRSGTVTPVSFTFTWSRAGDFKDKRWRVTAVAANGTPGTPSAWSGFRFDNRPSPVLVSPANGTVFTTLPRTTTLTWQPVTWAVAISLTIECFGCSTPDQWTVFQSVLMRETATSYTFDWPGAFRGRWHVSGFPPAPPAPPPSPTWEFEYTV